ncbi:MAG TPA: hypothetical protein VEU07_12385 [Candidatus Acidoferrum sp.]|nr:hypothetical protein [Candidatus Acidoferrum sp.]
MKPDAYLDDTLQEPPRLSSRLASPELLQMLVGLEEEPGVETRRGLGHRAPKRIRSGLLGACRVECGQKVCVGRHSLADACRIRVRIGRETDHPGDTLGLSGQAGRQLLSGVGSADMEQATRTDHPGKGTLPAALPTGKGRTPGFEEIGQWNLGLTPVAREFAQQSQPENAVSLAHVLEGPEQQIGQTISNGSSHAKKFREGIRNMLLRSKKKEDSSE